MARNVYALRCPPQLEDSAVRETYRAKAARALQLTEGPWLRPQLEKRPTELAISLVDSSRESPGRARLTVKVHNAGQRPAVMTQIQLDGSVQYVADDAMFWLEPGESRTVKLRVRLATAKPVAELVAKAVAWNAAEAKLTAPLRGIVPK